MMGPIKHTLLTDKFFIAGLFVLLVNDHILKYEFGGLLTGKLSDISGLFIFPFFWSVLFERYALRIYIITAFLFILWKSPVPNGLIDNVNYYVGTRFYRALDLTDLFTLIVIPISYQYFKIKLRADLTSSTDTKIHSFGICLLSITAFVATTQPSQEVKVNLKISEKMICNLSKEDIFAKRLKPRRGLSDKFAVNVADSSFLMIVRMNEQSWSKFEVWVKIYKIDGQKTMFEFDSLHSFTVTGRFFGGIDNEEVNKMNRLTRDDYIKVFKENVINTIENNNIIDPNLYFDNIRLDTSSGRN